MIVLAANKLIMRSKFPNNALFLISISWSYLQLTNRSWDRNCLIMLFWTIRQFWSHEKCHDHEIESLLGILTSWKVKKNLISWIRPLEKMNFDLMRFDLMIISQIICTVLYIYSCCYNYENKKAFDRIQVIRKPEWKISSKWNVSSKWNNVEFKASAGC